MRNIILSSIAIFILMSKLDTGTWGIAIALIAVIINFILQVKKDTNFKWF